MANSNQGNQGGNQGGKGQNEQSGDTSNRGFASMDPQQQREIAAEGGRAAHASGNAHEFTSEEAREAGRMSHQNDGNRQSGGQGQAGGAAGGSGSSGGGQGGNQQSGSAGRGSEGGSGSRQPRFLKRCARRHAGTARGSWPSEPQERLTVGGTGPPLERASLPTPCIAPGTCGSLFTCAALLAHPALLRGVRHHDCFFC